MYGICGTIETIMSQSKKRETRYWLMKSEPSELSISDLKQKKKARWDGIRNYQVRNMLRDEMQVGDIALFYHSNAESIGVVGIMRILQGSYTDPTQFDPESKYYDPLSQTKNPRWLAVIVQFVSIFNHIVTLTELKLDPTFKNLALVQKGNRLSVMPISARHFEAILDRAK